MTNGDILIVYLKHIFLGRHSVWVLWQQDGIKDKKKDTLSKDNSYFKWGKTREVGDITHHHATPVSHFIPLKSDNTNFTRLPFSSYFMYFFSLWFFWPNIVLFWILLLFSSWTIANNLKDNFTNRFIYKFTW